MHRLSFFTLSILLSMTTHAQATFLYEITLFDQFKHRTMWSEREQQIQKAHLAYLDSLTQAGRLEIAGIVDQGLEEQTGLIILTTSSYEEAQRIVQEDPSVKAGMMSARLRPIQVYFRKE